MTLFFVRCEEKDCYRVVSVGHLGLTAARTAGTATGVLSKSFFRSSFLSLSREKIGTKLVIGIKDNTKVALP